MKKTIEQQMETDWNIITIKVEDLRKTSHMEVTKKYLIRELNNCFRSYRTKYGTHYDPLVPPSERVLGDDDMGGII